MFTILGKSQVYHITKAPSQSSIRKARNTKYYNRGKVKQDKIHLRAHHQTAVMPRVKLSFKGQDEQDSGAAEVFVPRPAPSFTQNAHRLLMSCSFTAPARRIGSIIPSWRHAASSPSCCQVPVLQVGPLKQKHCFNVSGGAGTREMLQKAGMKSGMGSSQPDPRVFYNIL